MAAIEVSYAPGPGVASLATSSSLLYLIPNWNTVQAQEGKSQSVNQCDCPFTLFTVPVLVMSHQSHFPQLTLADGAEAFLEAV